MEQGKLDILIKLANGTPAQRRKAIEQLRLIGTKDRENWRQSPCGGLYRETEAEAKWVMMAECDDGKTYYRNPDNLDEWADSPFPGFDYSDYLVFGFVTLFPGDES